MIQPRVHFVSFISNSLLSSFAFALSFGNCLLVEYYLYYLLANLISQVTLFQTPLLVRQKNEFFPLHMVAPINICTYANVIKYHRQQLRDPPPPLIDTNMQSKDTIIFKENTHLHLKDIFLQPLHSISIMPINICTLQMSLDTKNDPPPPLIDTNTYMAKENTQNIFCICKQNFTHLVYICR